MPSLQLCRGRYCYRIANPILFYCYAAVGTNCAALGAFLLEQFLTVLQPSPDDQLENAAKEFLGSVLSAFGSAIKSANEPQSDTTSGEEAASDKQ